MPFGLDAFFGIEGYPRTMPHYPFQPFYFTEFRPAGDFKAVREVVDKALPSFAAVIEAVSNYLGVEPEQISLTRNYRKLANRTPLETAYADAVNKKLGKTPPIGFGGLGAEAPSTQKLATDALKKALIKAAEKAAIEAGGKAALSSVPGGAIAVPIASAITDFHGALATTDQKVSAGLSVTSGVATSGALSTISSSALIPVVGWVIAAGLVVKAVIDFRRSKEAMEREIHRAKELTHSINSAVSLALSETKKLAGAAATRDIVFAKTATPAYTKRLRDHYFSIFKNAYPKGTSFERSGGRNEIIMVFLQVARDMHLLKESLDMVSVIDVNTKLMAYDILAATHDLSADEAAAIAVEIVANVGGYLTVEARKELAKRVADAVALAKAAGKQAANAAVKAGASKAQAAQVVEQAEFEAGRAAAAQASQALKAQGGPQAPASSVGGGILAVAGVAAAALMLLGGKGGK